MSRLLIQNGTIVTGDDQFAADVFVIGEKIHAIGPELGRRFAVPPDELVDATGCYVFPGGIDAHTHMELPLKTTTSSDTFASGTGAALIGGTTTILDFANQIPGKTLKSAVKDWHAKANGKALCDYGFHVSVTDFNERTRREIAECVDEGITSFKTFMAYKGALMIDDRQMLEIMEEVKIQKGLVLTHAENGDLIDHLVEKFRKAGSLSPKFHPLSRPVIAEAEACSRIIDLARFADCPLYIVHLSSQSGLQRLAPALETGTEQRRSGKSEKPRAPIIAETCPQYLLLDDSVYSQRGFEGAKYVLSPPLRKASDQKHLWAGLGSGMIKVVATDHCAFTSAQRRLGVKDFSKIPNGVPGVEHRMELLYSEGVHKGRLSLQQFVNITSTNPARIFGLHPQKGAIHAGADADLVVFDPNEEHVISSKTHHMNCDYSVYEGVPVTGACRMTILRGKVVVRRGKLLAPAGYGKYLPRQKFEY
ncbi:MAG: dihydropyrimidinase [Bdellovibrionales bacterium GWB1_52_6]|nr:MAG: dihydropyrimidinase [Bdellovibrionales bacterium GWB1_52_6]OFZ04269.1 MAG: dihydropyrimidinase [Bdellovibrionales bacterium GWA1_52_35]HCM40884.1 dihydropyrimidinase [Bdellovibrionales bacterium]